MENVKRMGLGGMENQVENADKLATGLQHVMTVATICSALFASCIAVSFYSAFTIAGGFNVVIVSPSTHTVIRPNSLELRSRTLIAS